MRGCAGARTDSVDAPAESLVLNRQTVHLATCRQSDGGRGGGGLELCHPPQLVRSLGHRRVGACDNVPANPSTSIHPSRPLSPHILP